MVINVAQTKHDLTHAAANLSRNAPIQWQIFMEALAAHNNVCREQLVNSPIADLPVYQGRAQHMSALLELLKDCQTVAEKTQIRKPVQ